MKSTTSFDSNAGRLVLNFTNTVYERPGYDSSTPSAPVELLNSAEDLMRWCTTVEVLPRPALSELSKEWRSQPDLALKNLKMLIALREDLFKILYSLISTGSLSATQLTSLNTLIERQPAQVISKHASSFLLKWAPDLSALEKIRASIVLDTVELLTTEDTSRLRVCGAPECGWLFLDKSKNGRRRWCDMADCGNREKQRKFYARL